jgi:hypothetical protein
MSHNFHPSLCQSCRPHASTSPAFRPFAEPRRGSMCDSRRCSVEMLSAVLTSYPTTWSLVACSSHASTTSLRTVILRTTRITSWSCYWREFILQHFGMNSISSPSGDACSWQVWQYFRNIPQDSLISPEYVMDNITRFPSNETPVRHVIHEHLLLCTFICFLMFSCKSGISFDYG